ncbi:uncharacterized protein M6B38_350145 [Iris pallida]|uniref:Gamma-interferon-inducible lysosomal thiol reductase n=1 Tax=Iris pallida TaxID=29817 RepID=A0AAX6GRX0_IRIPA|nr:uncharacterized protein M6B38_350145 [Iris pallida]
MASIRFSVVFFLVSSLYFAPPSSCAGKVTLSLYYETLCPYCSNFIVNYLPKIFDDGLISVVDLELVPYGNARIGPNGTISCQHGRYECLLNTVEACAISAFPDMQVYFKFIYCVEQLVYEHKYMEWESCFPKTGLDSQAIVDCYNSGYGQKLELQFAAQTAALQPPHTYVPWVVVDGQPLYDDYTNFEAYICKAYDGSLPNACGGLAPQKVQVSDESQGCHVSEMIQSPVMEEREAKINMLL